MAITEVVKVAIIEELDRVAKQIEGELKAKCPVGETHQAINSIHIEEVGEFARSVGGTNDHLYYADQGSGATKKYIAFNPKGGINTKLRPYPSKDGKVHSFGRKAIPGLHFFKEVADRHR